MLIDELAQVLTANALVTAFVVVGVIMLVSYYLSARFSAGRIHGSAIAIGIGLLLAYAGGTMTGGKQGIADIPWLAGIGFMGGGMLRDFAIVATAFGVNAKLMKQAGVRGAISVLVGVLISFVAGAALAYLFGYRDAASITTIGAGAATYIVGPVTGTAVNATSDVIALSIAAGLVKSILVMITTPLVARHIGLTNPRAAMVFGGLLGTTSGVAAGLAATDPKLVPYGAMTATFYTGVGCLLAPSILFLIVGWMV